MSTKNLRCRGPSAKRSKQPGKLTPPEVARLLRCSPEKVIGWIRAGELKAINAAARLGGRPRYLVDRAELGDFERRRTVAPAQPRTHRRKRDPDDDYPDYY
jgi:hypothetical protein